MSQTRCLLSRLSLAAALLATASRPAAAQVDTASAPAAGPAGTGFEVSAITGYQWFDESAALQGAPLIGVRIVRPHIARLFTLGVNAAFTRPTTRGDYFPWNRQIYFSDAAGTNDTTLLFIASQRVVLATYGAELGARTTLGAGQRAFGAVELEGGLGLGWSTIWADPEQNNGPRAIGGWMWQAGAGLGVPLGRTSALRVRVDDIVLNDYDRDRLSLSDPLFSEDLFRNPAIDVPAKKRSIHNPRLSIAFSFIPGRDR